MPIIEKMVEIAPQHFQRVEEYVEDPTTGAHARKAAEIEKIIVIHNNKKYAVTSGVMEKMNHIITSTTFQVMQRVVNNGDTISQAWTAVMVNNTFDWRTFNGEKVTITFEELGNILKKATIEMKNTYENDGI
jgi:hypothetical protein